MNWNSLWTFCRESAKIHSHFFDFWKVHDFENSHIQICDTKVMVEGVHGKLLELWWSFDNKILAQKLTSSSQQ